VTTTYISKLSGAWHKNNTLLCVGLDPDITKLPAQFQAKDEGIADFCRAIIDATAEFACAFKPQIAYFSAIGAEPQLEKI